MTKQTVPQVPRAYYNRGNQINALVITDAQGRQFYYSYKTLVAFSAENTGLVCIINYWQNTTGRHLACIQPDRAKRVDQKTFDALLLLALSGEILPAGAVVHG